MTEQKPKSSQGRQDYAQKKETERQIRKTRNAIEVVEKRIETLETEIAEWDAKLSDPSAHGIDLSDEAVFANYNKLRSDLAYEEHEWEKLNYELELLND